MKCVIGNDILNLCWTIYIEKVLKLHPLPHIHKKYLFSGPFSSTSLGKISDTLPYFEIYKM